MYKPVLVVLCSFSLAFSSEPIKNQPIKTNTLSSSVLVKNNNKTIILEPMHAGPVTGKVFGVITKVGGYAGIAIASWFHTETLIHAEELKHGVDAAALVAEAVGMSLPTP